MSNLKKILVERKNCKSVWFMRQAGRYLPEFRKIRSQNKNFINLCLNSNLSSEITLQPIKRFDLDSAIIFSDILLVPYALGQEVNFIKNSGPILSEFEIKKFLDNNTVDFTKTLQPIYNAIKITRKKLNKEKSLISFIGAPWTLLIYMMGLKEGGKKINFSKIKKIGTEIDKIFNHLNDYLCLHIKNQIDAGANVVQVFDSWAGLLSNTDLERFCYAPNRKIVDFCKKENIPVICFPKGIKENYIKFNNVVKPNGINLDYDVDPAWAKECLHNVTLQGGMDPKILLQSDQDIFNEAKKYLDIFKDVPYIFNLGHGLIPETNPDKLNKLINFIREYK